MRFMERRAFTLIELLVVIAIIGLLSAVAIIATSSARTNARNQKRKADLIQISKALEMYYADNGTYPINGAWWGNCSGYGSHANSGPSGWIPNLAPAYMAVLPTDPTQGQNHSAWGVCNDTRACYLYMSNATGTDYKVMAFCTPEGTWTTSDPFYDSVYPISGWSVHTPNATW